MQQKKCSRGCKSPVVGRGFCDTHYRAWYRTKKPLYSIWINMNQRCYNTQHPRYPDWGGRGIQVCERWRNSYEDFEKDMGDRPENTSLDRINNDGDYKPGNCRWATRSKQAFNSRVRATNTSGVRGVCWFKPQQQWKAGITINKKHIFIGYFSEFEDAVKARKEAEINLL